MDKIQEYDTDQVEFVKFNLEKFSSMLELLGTETQQQGELMIQAVRKINPQEDIDALISNNKSTSCTVKREEFQEYNAKEMSSKFKNQDKTLNYDSQRKQNTEPMRANEVRVIQDNYIQIGPNKVIEAGYKAEPKRNDSFELVSKQDTVENDAQMLQTKMRQMIHQSKLI